MRSPTTRSSSTRRWTTGWRLGHHQRAVVCVAARSRRRHPCPGLSVRPARAHRATHNVLLAHGLAAARLHEPAPPTSASCSTWRRSGPRTPDADARSHRRHRRVPQPGLDRPLVDGAYDDGLLARRAGARRPGARAGRRPRPRAGLGRLDGRQLLHAVPAHARRRRRSLHPEAEAYPGVRRVSFVVREPRTDIGWEVDAGASRSSWSTPTPTGLPSWSPRTARRTPTTGSSRSARRRPGPDRLPARPHRRHRAGAGRPGPTSAATSCGPCWTTSSGPRATPRPSASCTSTPGPDPDARGVLHWLAEHIADTSA